MKLAPIDRLMLLPPAITDFLEFLRVERGLADRTRRAYEGDLLRMQDYLTKGGTVKLALEDIGPLHVKDFVAHLRDDLGYKPRSLSRAMSTLRVFFDHHVRFERLDRSPAASLRNPKVPKKLPVYLVEDEMRRLLRAPERTTPDGFRDYTILVTFLFTGLRLGELTGMEIAGVDFSARTIRVLGKGSKERIIPMHELVAVAMQRYLAECRSSPADAGAARFVFLTDRGEPVTARMVGYVVTRTVKEAGVSHLVTPHKLRHTFATQLLHRGATLMEIKDLLGHSHISTTSIYTHTNVDRLQKAVDRIAR